VSGAKDILMKIAIVPRPHDRVPDNFVLMAAKLLQYFDFGVRGVLCGERRSSALEHLAHVVKFDDSFLCETGDREALAWFMYKQALCFQTLHRLAHRGSAHVQLRGQFHLDNSGRRRQGSVLNRFDERLIRFLTQPASAALSHLLNFLCRCFQAACARDGAGLES
jgi:hypothetical protein